MAKPYPCHHNDVIMGAIASQITSLAIVYSTVYSGEDQRKHQSSASLAFVWGIHRWPVNSPHKGPVTRKMLPFDDVIMPWRHHEIHTMQVGVVVDVILFQTPFMPNGLKQCLSFTSLFTVIVKSWPQQTGIGATNDSISLWSKGKFQNIWVHNMFVRLNTQWSAYYRSISELGIWIWIGIHGSSEIYLRSHRKWHR